MKQKNNMSQYKNYKDAIYAAYPDIVGEDGLAEPDFDGLHILGKVSEPKLTQILSDSTSLSEFKLLTKQALDTTIEEENMKRDEWEKQQEQEEYDLQANMDEVYAKATVDGDIRNLKADYVMNLNNQRTLQDYLELNQIKPYSSKEAQSMFYNPRNTPKYIENLTKTVDRLENYSNGSEHQEMWGIEGNECGIYKNENGQVEGFGTKLLTYEKDAIEAYNFMHGHSDIETPSPMVQHNLNVDMQVEENELEM